MKLYFSPGTCSLSPHIALREAGLDFELVRVDIRQRKLADGSDFTAINRKGYVPVLELDNGLRLTEGPAIVQYIADRKPASGTLPAVLSSTASILTVSPSPGTAVCGRTCAINILPIAANRWRPVSGQGRATVTLFNSTASPPPRSGNRARSGQE